ncbi:MAG: alpha/beta fold hydrolase [Phaeodactylibacter sp.]|nr:alpha/beta fold hydrolase [Phaeodactylibacter sp.]MCB9289225.1 alpha/beta fold hydrolase [Lewinellaceae bacterium]
MPYLTSNGARIYYEDTGEGKETIIFSHGLLWSSRMFSEQIRHLGGRYRVIAYDHRGQGRSEVTGDGYDMDTLAQDALGLMDALSIRRCHFAGLSMGGFVALRLAVRHPERIQSLILMETTAQPEPAENIPRYRMLKNIVRLLGPWAVKKPVMRIMFGKAFLEDASRQPQRLQWEKELTANKRTITRAVQGVITRKGVQPESLAKIQCPTLIIVGDQDVATVPAKSEYMHQHIPNSRLALVPNAGHTSSVEEPEAINAAIDDFLEAIT